MFNYYVILIPMNFFIWILIIFIAPIPVTIGILLSIPIIFIIFIAVLLASLLTYFRKRFHPLKRKKRPPIYWLWNYASTWESTSALFKRNNCTSVLISMMIYDNWKGLHDFYKIIGLSCGLCLLFWPFSHSFILSQRPFSASPGSGLLNHSCFS